MARKKISFRSKWPLPVFAFFLGIGLGYRGYEYFPPRGHIEVHGQAEAIFDIRFSPKGGGLALVLDTLAMAQDHVYVHTYSFTSKEITQALIHAHQRGVRVRVIADKRESKSSHCKLDDLVKAGIEVRIDKVSGLAHNKVMVVDDTWVITGSYNWSAAAEKRNAENILRIASKEVNASYRDNFSMRYAQATLL